MIRYGNGNPGEIAIAYVADKVTSASDSTTRTVVKHLKVDCRRNHFFVIKLVNDKVIHSTSLWDLIIKIAPLKVMFAAGGSIQKVCEGECLTLFICKRSFCFGLQSQMEGRDG